MSNIFAFEGFRPVVSEYSFVHPNATVIGNVIIGREVYIASGAVIMDNAVIGTGSIVGALCFVPADMSLPERKIVAGNPAKIIGDVTDQRLAWKEEGTRLYRQLPARLADSLEACEPLREIPPDRPDQDATLKARRRASQS